MKTNIKRIWNKWEILCNKHNEGIDYVNYEEYISPKDIFLPLLLTMLIWVFIGLTGLFVKFGVCSKFFVVAIIMFIVLLLVNYSIFFLSFIVGFNKK